MKKTRVPPHATTLKYLGSQGTDYYGYMEHHLFKQPFFSQARHWYSHIWELRGREMEPELLSAFCKAILSVFKAVKKSLRKYPITVYTKRKFNIAVH